MSIKSLFNSLASAADTPGMIPPLDANLDVLSRAYYHVPAIIPGASIGAVSVNDMANRLLARGATPRYMAATVAVDPDMPASKLRYIAAAMREAAVEAEVEFTSVDTLIVDSGLPSGVAVSLTGIGETAPGGRRAPECCRPGDVLIMTGRAGAHGAALYEARHRSLFIPPVLTDSASLGDVVHNLQRVVAHDLRMLYYPAEGVIKALAAIEQLTGRQIEFTRDAAAVSSIVAAAAHVIRVSPLALDCAGAMMAVVSPDKAEEALAAARRASHGSHAAVIGHIR